MKRLGLLGMGGLALVLAVGCGGSDDPDAEDAKKGKKKGKDDTTTTASDIVTGGQIFCADPSMRATSEFDQVVSDTPANSDIWLWASGVIIADLNEDGHHDFIAPAEPYAKLYMGSEHGLFTEESERLDAFDLTMGVGGTVVDYNGDGHLDVYITRYLAPNVLLENDGQANFTDVTATAGIQAGEYRSMSASWADIDHDGDLDLFVGNYGYVDESGTETEDFEPAEPSYLYLNDGDGTFTDISDTLSNVVHDGYTYVAILHDLNNDGWADLYVINDFGPAFPNIMLLNEQGTFVESSHTTYGLNLMMTGMGLGIGDLNGDDKPDMVIPEWNAVSLMMTSSAHDLWIESSESKGVTNAIGRKQKVGWGTEMVDMDNDGDLDIIMAYGHVANENPKWSNPDYQPDALYIQDDAGQFTDMGVEWGVDDDGVGRGFGIADFNNDGYIDIVKRDIDGPNVIYTSNCGDNAWLRIRLHAPAPNTFAVGAKVTVTAGDLVQSRYVLSGGTGYAFGGPPEVHFGFGDIEQVDEISVQWPDMSVSVYDGAEYDNLQTRQIIDITKK